MANEEEGSTSEQPPQETAAKGGLAKEWRKLATWQKAGVVIAGVGVVAALIYYVNHQSTPTATGNDAVNSGTPGSSYGLPTGSYTGYPGEGDQFPPMPVSQPTGGPTSNPPANPTPVSPPAPGQPPVARPLPVGLPGPVSGPIQPRQTITPLPAAKAAPVRTITPQYGSARPIAGGAVGARYGIAPKAAAAPKAPAYTPAKSAALQRAIYNR